MSIEEYRAAVAAPSRRRSSKYGNAKTEYVSPLCGKRTYDSKAEAAHAAELDVQVHAGHGGHHGRHGHLASCRRHHPKRGEPLLEFA